MNEKSMPDIENILSSLGEDDIQALKKAAESIFGEGGAPEPRQEQTGTPGFGDLFSNPEMLQKISKIMSAMNQPNSRSNLIAALKPLLSEPRRKRADEAMQMLRLIEIMPMLQNELGKENSNE